MIVLTMFTSRRKTFLPYRGLNLLRLAACFVAAWLPGCPSTALAQEQVGQTPGPASLVVSVPAPLGGTSPQLRPTSEGEVSNVLGGGLTLGTLFDDNAVSLNGQHFREYQYYVLPTFTLQQTRPHTAWSLDYRGGLTIDHTAVDATPALQEATEATADLQHAFGRRLLLELREDYIHTNNTLSSTGPSPSLATLSGSGQLSSFAAALEATRTAYISSGNLTYQLTEHSSMGFSGNFSAQSFSAVETAPGVALNLFDTRTTTGRGFYVREISAHQKVGFEYQLQDLRFQGDLARTVDQTFFLFDEIALKTNMTLVLFAGPDCAHMHNNILMLGSNSSTSVVPGINDLWSPAGGGMFTWRGKHVALSMSGQRVVTDGGASAGAVRTTSASAELRKDFTSRWSASLRYAYSDGWVLEGPANAANSKITLEQGGLILERRFTKDLSVRAQYARIQQMSSGAPAPLTTGNHNRVGVELVYQFTRPLGR